MPMETVSEALERLTTAGYVHEYRAEARGLRNLANGTVLPPERFRVDEVVRFEGDSDPSDESVVLAVVSTTDGTKGTYTIAYGPLMDALDAEMVSRIGWPRR
jgi:hypothetical protein